MQSEVKRQERYRAVRAVVRCGAVAFVAHSASWIRESEPGMEIVWTNVSLGVCHADEDDTD